MVALSNPETLASHVTRRVVTEQWPKQPLETLVDPPSRDSFTRRVSIPKDGGRLVVDVFCLVLDEQDEYGQPVKVIEFSAIRYGWMDRRDYRRPFCVTVEDQLRAERMQMEAL